MTKLKFKIPEIDFPGKFEMFLILGLAFLLFWFDILQNKILDFGNDMRVTFFTGFTMLAKELILIVVFLYIIFMAGLMLRNVWDKKRHLLDFLFSITMLVGFMFLIVGFVGGILLGYPTTFYDVFQMNQIDIYHMGILIEILSIFYFGFTK